MEDDGTTLILTRPADRSEEFLSQCEARAGRRLSAVIAPVIEIVPFGELPDLNAYETIILTSPSAVSRLAAERALTGKSVATVGERTAELARSHGADADCLGEDVAAFLSSETPISAPAVHCRGVHARGDLAGRLTRAGTLCDEAVIYDQVQKPLTAAARAVLSSEDRVVLPLFSPRSARLVSQSVAGTGHLVIIAMSEAVAAEWMGGGDIRIAQEPTSAAMCDLVIGAF